MNIEQGEKDTVSRASMLLNRDRKGRYVKLEGFDAEKLTAIWVETSSDGRLLVKDKGRNSGKPIAVENGKIYDKSLLMFFFVGECKKMNFLKMGNTYYQVLGN